MKKVRLGFLGCGGIARYHGKDITTKVPEAEIVALCDTHPGNLALFQKEILTPVNQKADTFVDYRDMFAKAELDGVLIATPHTHHYQQATDALDAGLHVLLEKPMVTEVEEAYQLVKHVQKAKRVFSLAFPGPFCAPFQYIQQMIAKGELGEVMMVNAFLSQNWLQLTGGTWRQDPKLSGGGQAYDSGAHMFNAMLYLTGLRPVEVFAWMDNRGAPVDINTVATVKYENGALGSAFVGGADVSGWQSSMYVSATKRSFRTGTHSGPLELWDEKAQKLKPELPVVTSLQQNFVDCILGRAETPCPVIWGLRQALLMDALYTSAKTGQPAKVKPE